MAAARTARTLRWTRWLWVLLSFAVAGCPNPNDTVPDDGQPAEGAGPHAAAGVDQADFIGQLLQFSGSGSTDPDGTITSWDSDFGDGTSHGTAEEVFHAYAAAGVYTVALTVTDDHARSASDSLVATVAALAPTRMPGTNGPVFAIARIGTTFYLGGEFSAVGPATGSAVVVDGESGELGGGDRACADHERQRAGDGVCNLSRRVGRMLRGRHFHAGGIGGADQPRTHQPRRDRQFVESWRKRRCSGTRARKWCDLCRGRVHLCGRQSRNRIAALIPSTDPRSRRVGSEQQRHRVLPPAGRRGACPGGGFTSIGGQARNRIAALSATGTGAADATWNPNSNGWVYALAVSGSMRLSRRLVFADRRPVDRPPRCPEQRHGKRRGNVETFAGGRGVLRCDRARYRLLRGMVFGRRGI